jgi:hypothetical protein
MVPRVKKRESKAFYLFWWWYRGGWSVVGLIGLLFAPKCWRKLLSNRSKQMILQWVKPKNIVVSFIRFKKVIQRPTTTHSFNKVKSSQTPFVLETSALLVQRRQGQVLPPQGLWVSCA